MCAWHIQQNFKKKFTFLNRTKKGDKIKDKENKASLYRSIINLAFSNYPEDFEEEFNAIAKSVYLDNSLKEYLREKYKKAESWAKCYMKKNFCCGTCTSSRIESKHKIFKKFLNSAKRLTELFRVIKNLEETEIGKFKEEIEKMSKEESQNIEKYDLIKSLKQKYSSYCMKILKKNLLESLNYKITKKKDNFW